MATYVTPVISRRIEKYKAKLEALRIARVNELKMKAHALANLTINIEANATEEGHLYGSVTALDIAKAIKAQKVDIADDNIRLEGVIKDLGQFKVPVHLGEDVTAEINVWVVPAKLQVRVFKLTQVLGSFSLPKPEDSDL